MFQKRSEPPGTRPPPPKGKKPPQRKAVRGADLYPKGKAAPGAC